MKKIKNYNIWKIDGYCGWNDYDGPADCNRHDEYIMDANFKKQDVIEMWMSINRGRVVTVAKCEIIASGKIEYIEE